MAVNEPSPRAKPEDKVYLRCHKSLATRAITIIYPHLIGPDCGTRSKSIVTVTVNKSDVHGNRESSKKLIVVCLPFYHAGSNGYFQSTSV